MRVLVLWTQATVPWRSTLRSIATSQRKGGIQASKGQSAASVLPPMPPARRSATAERRVLRDDIQRRLGTQRVAHHNRSLISFLI